ncbi:MAG: ribbon-helix-helix protein, CopG family [Actinomycetota bacterium]|nr:ribbon-helix-helix protein, CopG family [Actinomycetota bacterium]
MLRCVRTTIRLDEQLLREAKAHAARTGRTLTAVIEDALRASFQRARLAPAEHASPPVFRPRRRRGLQPGVDLSDSSTLLDLMESVDSDPA